MCAINSVHIFYTRKQIWIVLCIVIKPINTSFTTRSLICVLTATSFFQFNLLIFLYSFPPSSQESIIQYIFQSCDLESLIFIPLKSPYVFLNFAQKYSPQLLSSSSWMILNEVQDDSLNFSRQWYVFTVVSQFYIKLLKTLSWPPT